MIATPRIKPSTENLTKCELLPGRAVARLLSRRPLEHQRELLATPEFRRRVAPELLRWHQRRVARQLLRQSQQIDALRRTCRCRRCRGLGAKPLPSYYVVNHLSYECHLERRQADPDLEEILATLRNDRARVGSAFVARPRLTGP